MDDIVDRFIMIFALHPVRQIQEFLQLKKEKRLKQKTFLENLGD